jgi:hypothetical protein
MSTTWLESYSFPRIFKGLRERTGLLRGLRSFCSRHSLKTGRNETLKPSSATFSPEDISSVKPPVGKSPGTLLGVGHQDHFVAAAPKQRRTRAVLFTTLVFEETWHPTTTDKKANASDLHPEPSGRTANVNCHTPSSMTKSSQPRTARVAPSKKALRQLEHEIRSSIIAELKFRGLQALATNGKVEVPCQAS